MKLEYSYIMDESIRLRKLFDAYSEHFFNFIILVE